ncbi:MAG: CHASE3 domain-containing protein [Actinomycetota bacterium]|nr:CHASE3 domain-containing protein [Actinomycetota bacterium]
MLNPRSKYNTVKVWLSLSLGALVGMLLLTSLTIFYESYAVSSYYLKRQEQTSDLAQDATRLEAALLNMETGKRGFLLSANDSFLRPYEDGRRQFEELLDHARRLEEQSGNELVDPQIFDALREEYEGIVTFFEQQIEERREGETDPAQLRLDEGKAEVDRARETLGDLQRQALASRDAARERTEKAVERETLLAVVIGGGALQVGLVAFVFVRKGLIRPLVNLRNDALATSHLLRSRSANKRLGGQYEPLEMWEQTGAPNVTKAREILDVREAFGTMVGQLRRQAERVRSLVSSIKDPLVTVDLDRRIQYFNEAAETLAGFSSEEVEGKDLGELVTKDDGMPLSLQAVKATGEPVGGLRRGCGGVTRTRSTSPPRSRRLWGRAARWSEVCRLCATSPNARTRSRGCATARSSTANLSRPFRRASLLSTPKTRPSFTATMPTRRFWSSQPERLQAGSFLISSTRHRRRRHYARRRCGRRGLAPRTR